MATITNIVGDYYVLIPKYGLQGAAIATATASALSALVLLQSVRNKTMEWKRLLMAQDETSTVNASTRKNGAEINGSKVNGSNTTLEEDPVATIVVDGKPTLNTTFAQTFAITSTVSENATSLVSTGLSRDSSIYHRYRPRRQAVTLRTVLLLNLPLSQNDCVLGVDAETLLALCQTKIITTTIIFHSFRCQMDVRQSS